MLRVYDSGRQIDLQKVQCVWYRKPEPVDIAHFEVEQGALGYVESEFREILDNLYALLSNVPWINNPFKIKPAHRKMLQLQVAAKVGFKTPQTLVTNDPAAALRHRGYSSREVRVIELIRCCAPLFVRAILKH